MSELKQIYTKTVNTVEGITKTVEFISSNPDITEKQLSALADQAITGTNLRLLQVPGVKVELSIRPTPETVTLPTIGSMRSEINKAIADGYKKFYKEYTSVAVISGEKLSNEYMFMLLWRNNKNAWQSIADEINAPINRLKEENAYLKEALSAADTKLDECKHRIDEYQRRLKVIRDHA